MVISISVLVSILLVNSGFLKAEEAAQSENPLFVMPAAPLPEGSPYVLPMPREFLGSTHLHGVLFDRGSAKIRKDMLPVLAKNAEWLKRNENYLIMVQGHADETGTNVSNLYLSEERAKTVRDYLILAGVEANRIIVIYYGEEKPVAFEHNEGAWKQNRRVSFLIREWR